ncbi:MAG: 16S rRNA (guanine(527)-N(7))-methyltransferase RsmG [Ruminococcaceae bacterium]|nr:16S rRNA (guanine(527)-N(7))-methyltransferase RsmG [Oscillospiraceae bacterium]
MDLLDFKEKFTTALEENTVVVELTDARIEKLYELTKVMLEVNRSMNLTAITDEDAIILKHYVDSLTVSSYIPQNATVIDVGCGAGFPCVPLAIFREDLKITALDSTAKRIRYIDDTANKLGITNITPIAARAEEFGKQIEYRERFEIATARAVAALPILSELCLPFVKIGGKFIAMKASQGLQEANDAQNAIRLCGGSIGAVDKLVLKAPQSTEERTIISVSKVSSTPSKYPRHYSQITKKSL